MAVLENFDFDLTFTVTSFTVSAMVGGFLKSYTCSSNRFSSDATNVINKASRGNKVYIEDVKAKGPDGTVRNLGTIAFTID
jgi:hypothetical protein